MVGFRPERGAGHLRETATEVATARCRRSGYRFIEEYTVKKLTRDVKIMPLYEGTPRIKRPVIAREELLGRREDEAAVAA